MNDTPIQDVLVLGGGSAGLITAITIKKRLPALRVELLRSPEIGIIQVGEGTFPYLPKFFHGYLDLDPARFYREVRPTWKLGIKFLWGPRPLFHYTFRPQFDTRFVRLPKPTGFYCHDEIGYPDIATALMDHDKATFRRNGAVFLGGDIAYHLENAKLVTYLENVARELGVIFTEGTVGEVIPSAHGREEGIDGIRLESGETRRAGLYVDASGFRSLLLGSALGVEFEDFRSTLFCDRAVVGGWERADDPLLPYTTAETMDAGWCWQIEHRDRINRGYVFSSSFLSEDAAEEEFRRKNPKLGETRIIPFRSGIHRRPWVGNVVAVGNAAGFVEPLESTSLGQICQDAQGIAESLADTGGRLSATHARQHGNRFRRSWHAIRRFLALHYRPNTRLKTPFWKTCVEECDLAGAEEVLDYYRENGPSTLWRHTLLDHFDQFNFDGYLSMLIGMKVPHANPHTPTQAELATWSQIQENHLTGATRYGLSQEEALAAVESPEWQWQPDFYRNLWMKEKAG